MLSGIDVSHHQLEVNWTDVAATEVRFCFIKATEGASIVDRRFAENWTGAAGVGLLRGAYHFFHPSVSSATQADSFIHTVGSLQPGDLPPVLDLEVPAEWAGITAADRAPLAVQWLEAVESRFGVTPFVYLSPSFANAILMNASALARFPLWLAHYTKAPSPTVPRPWNAWTFWQYSSAGTTVGVPEPVDLNRFNGSLDDLKALTVQPATP